MYVQLYDVRTYLQTIFLKAIYLSRKLIECLTEHSIPPTVTTLNLKGTTYNCY